MLNEVSQLIEVGRYMTAHGLTWGNSGNISARIDADSFLITATGASLGELGEDDFALCSTGEDWRAGTETGSAGEGRKPSKEVPMHQAVYEARPDINAVLHASPLYGTLAACTDEELGGGWFIEQAYYMERVERVPYAHPGTAELGRLVRERAGKANVLLLDNHGVLVYDVSVREALMALHTLESAYRMLVEARSAGIALKRIPAEAAADLLERAAYKPRRVWPE